jgi:putative photosynthetic complex assembly protein 2
MTGIGLPALFAALVWWFMTGAILYLDGLPRWTFRWSFSAASLLLVGVLYDLHASAADTSVQGAYTAFTCAVLAWGWLEMSFLMGFVTGPRKTACGAGCPGGWAHFVHATEAIIYNELATLAGGLTVLALTSGGANKVGLWTYLVLWSMRLSAKLNLFLGVPNRGESFLPEHLQYLAAFFRNRRMNLLFPVSIAGSTIVAVQLAQRCLAADDPARVVGLALVTSLLVLAIVEHWFMVLPIRVERLWSWAFRRLPAAPIVKPSSAV